MNIETAQSTLLVPPKNPVTSREKGKIEARTAQEDASISHVMKKDALFNALREAVELDIPKQDTVKWPPLSRQYLA
ncbi:hypothetical protein [Methylovulum psychrotolerans]|uniref:Uncharacterized protein n=1 Tax=Methylovulum psychrotolerans TaxID=1704499 RepID=A0A2S5CKG0_9GAMM|nr:hypothetical protein [Methylovulum psychrotolerans]POZ51305.1 hypothetical protein AADEFJLK_02753 [Methylovulum psychrotolerans]